MSQTTSIDRQDIDTNARIDRTSVRALIAPVDQPVVVLSLDVDGLICEALNDRAIVCWPTPAQTPRDAPWKRRFAARSAR